MGFFHYCFHSCSFDVLLLVSKCDVILSSDLLFDSICLHEEKNDEIDVDICTFLLPSSNLQPTNWPSDQPTPAFSSIYSLKYVGVLTIKPKPISSGSIACRFPRRNWNCTELLTSVFRRHLAAGGLIQYMSRAGTRTGDIKLNWTSSAVRRPVFFYTWSAAILEPLCLSLATQINSKTSDWQILYSTIYMTCLLMDISSL